MGRAAIYTRISNDLDGAQTSTERQEADCRRRCRELGHDEVQLYTDVGISGFRDVRRPAFDALLDDLATGTLDCVVIWKLDRLSRQGIVAIGRFIEALRLGGAELVSLHDPVDTSTAMGEGVLGLLASVAKQESQNISLRTVAAKAHAAHNGAPRDGGPRSFGLTRDGASIVPAEAALIEEVADRVIAGEALRHIVADWTQRGVRTSTGRPFTPQSLRQLLLQPRLAGDRIYRGTVVATDVVPAVLGRDKATQVAAVLDKRTRGPRTTVGKYLLSGMLRCHRCKARLRANVAVNGRSRYSCPAPPEGCASIAVLRQPVEAEVFARLLASLDLRRMSDTTVPDPTGPLLVELELLDADQAHLARDYYADKVIGRHQFFAASEAITERISDVRSRIAVAAREVAHAPLLADPGTLTAEWATLDLGRQRAILDRFIDHVTIHPATHSRGKFDRERVEVVWRG